MTKAALYIERTGQVLLVLMFVVGSFIYSHDANVAKVEVSKHRAENLKKWSAEWEKEARQNMYNEAARQIKADAKAMGKGHACVAKPNGLPVFVLAHKAGTVKVERITTNKAFTKGSGYWLDSFCYKN